MARIRRPGRTMQAAAALLALCSSAMGDSAQQIAERAFPSVVLLVMADVHGQPVSLASGFFAADGLVVTNRHVIEQAASGYAKRIGEAVRAPVRGVVGMDASRDLALLAVGETEAPPLALADSREVAVGDQVYVIGNPQGLEGTFSQGIVSAIRRVGSDSLLQITAPVSPGSSGGPVLDAEGKVIGVAVATVSGGQNLNFAIPSAYLEPLLRDPGVPTPLAPDQAPRRPPCVLDEFGRSCIEAVAAVQLKWESPATGKYSFSLRNMLQVAVRQVYCLVVFYDADGNPIDIDPVRYGGTIPPGLAKRIASKVHASVQDMATEEGGRAEMRILDFVLAE